MSTPDMFNYFQTPDRSISRKDNKLILGGTALVGDYDITAERFGAILRNATENTIFAKTPEDFANIDSTKNYIVDGPIDMTGVSVEVPEGGISLSGLNGARDTSILYSTEDNYTMFTSPAGGYSGNVVLESCTIDVTGTGSKVFDLDNDGNSGAIDITGVNFGRSPTARLTSLGDLTDYRQLLLNGVGFIFCDDGLTFNGTWTGLAALTSIAVGFADNATLLKEGAGLTFSGSVRSDVNFLSTGANSEFLDFTDANILADAGLDLQNVRASASNPIPNISGSSVKAKFSKCRGIRNTYIGGEWAISSEVATVISTQNTLVKAAGVTAYDDLQHFSQTISNAFVYDSDQVIEAEIKGAISLSGTNNNVIGLQLRLWDDSASAYVDLGARFAGTMNASGRVENLAFFAHGVIDQGDRVELWVENQTSTATITLGLGGFLGVSERAS